MCIYLLKKMKEWEFILKEWFEVCILKHCVVLLKTWSIEFVTVHLRNKSRGQELNVALLIQVALFSQSHIQLTVCHHTDLVSGTNKFHILMGNCWWIQKRGTWPKYPIFIVARKWAVLWNVHSLLCLHGKNCPFDILICQYFESFTAKIENLVYSSACTFSRWMCFFKCIWNLLTFE